MPLVQLIVALVIVGVILWVVETLIPIDQTIRRLIQVVVIIAVLIWLLRAFALI